MKLVFEKFELILHNFILFFVCFINFTGVKLNEPKRFETNHTFFYSLSVLKRKN